MIFSQGVWAAVEIYGGASIDGEYSLSFP